MLKIDMNNICLIRPPKVSPEGFFTSGGALPPIGLAYLAASLEKADFNVRAIDGVGENITNFYTISELDNTRIQGMFLDEIVSEIPQDLLFIGISCMFSCEWFVYELLINKIKAQFPNVPIIVGGEHATAESMNILKICKSVDICALGEGELTIVELANYFRDKKNLSEINGIVYRFEDKIIKTKSRDRIKDINTIAAPLWEKIPVRNYLEMGYGMATTNRKSMPIIASRGCPYRCTFCTSPQMWGTDLNLRRPVLIVAEIKEYIVKYKIEHIDFLDIVGMMNKEWVVELLTLMIREKLEVTWLLGSGTRSEILDSNILKLFKESNVLRIFYSPESGSKETLKRIKKKVNLKKMTLSMKEASRLQISMRAPLIYGFPDQTLKEAFQSLFYGFYLSFIGVDDVVAHAFSAHPGTELHSQLISQGNINVENLINNQEYNQFMRNEFGNKVSGLHSWSNHIPNWTLPFFQFGGMSISYLILFIFHPKKLIKSFERIFISKKPITLFDHVLYILFVSKNKKAARSMQYVKSN
jgi:radical SAM superfamily enzyme YgiQ (UPF0313 family)